MLTRHIAPLLQEALSDTPVVVVNGARQTGKSTLVQSLAGATLPQAPSRQYLTLDDAVVQSAAKSDPAGFINGLSGPVTLDEVQRAPELFLAIKAAVDRNRQPGRFLLTGSADVLLLPGIADSLAGRVEVLSLWPLSSAELAGSPTLNRADCLFNGDLATLAAPAEPAELAGDATQNPRNALIERLVAGGFADAVTRSTARRRAAWFDSYVQSILQRDVRDLAHIEQLTEIPNLLQLLAARSASLLNFAELSRSSGLPQSTLKRYFALLEMLFLVVRVSPWERNAGKRLVKAPKVFLPDSGLLCHLMGDTAASLADKAGLPGAAVETFVLAELLKHIAFSAQHLTLWHYRTQNHIEVDFILENRLGQITGIEVKASSTVDSKDFKGLRHLQTTEPAIFQRGIVLYAGRDVVPFGENLWAVPLGVWWSERLQT
ncbi:MAG: ATP-binding protein [Gammaproteobacteria bacterium]|uniref:ATP-binding protein n=1 Tax=Rhodoferax sp. TaxID=50421 RepID=UPI0017941369|nr:ATP-binding protein [Rhodoferax sp.]MBU3898351.1 ATP-binding protein [Gammaproteobacteria bacterium]MBA3058692.1 ATP-binding protein [Rhodoferax sp.]MBU3996184.1 ATP-binding protein [Gammaproteobacteria bacterium]MBU4081536.1 ATP-binding protein [Gammaproteobacteria bacterium]MBU4114915.1 ATP-binding protein [Gammaproteobacteria bacterium]